jgi:hypothetical protein
MDLCIFEKLPLGNVGLDLIGGNEIVMRAVDFARSGRSGGVRYGEPKFGCGECLQEGVDDGPLADATGSANDNGAWPFHTVVVAVVFRHCVEIFAGFRGRSRQIESCSGGLESAATSGGVNCRTCH